MRYLSRKIKIKITLTEAPKRGKLEEASAAYHRKLHVISKLLTHFSPVSHFYTP